MDNKAEKKEKRRYFLRKEVLALLILFMLFGYGGINVMRNYELYADTIRGEYDKVVNGESAIAESISAFENVLTEEAVERMKFIEVYSFEHVLLGKEEIKNFSYIRDRKGFLHYASFYRDHDDTLFEIALRVKNLQEAVEQKGTKVLFVIPPAKGSTVLGDFSIGLPINDPYRNVDELLFWLNRLGVRTLNYAEYMPNADLPFEEVFFKTDHHWTVEAAYYATQILVDELNRLGGVGIGDISQMPVTKVTYKNSMLGSMGRGAGINFAGIEDFTAYYINPNMRFRRETVHEDGREEVLEGDYVDTIMDHTVLNKEDPYKNQIYSLYMNAIRPYDYVENLSNPDGIRMLMIRDSYFAPVMSFLAPLTGRLDSIWSLEQMESVSVEERLAANTYDYIVIEVYPYNISEDAFQYFESHRE